MERPSTSDSRMNSCRFVRRGMAHSGEKVDAALPFRLGEPDLAREIVQMPDQAAHHLAQAF